MWNKNREKAKNRKQNEQTSIGKHVNANEYKATGIHIERERRQIVVAVGATNKFLLTSE